MVTKLVNGDYVQNLWGGLETASGAEELLQRILFKLSARKGAFPLMPEFGSRLYLLYREKTMDRTGAATQYIKEALSDEKDLELRNVKVSEKEGEIELCVEFEYMGSEFKVDLTV